MSKIKTILLAVFISQCSLGQELDWTLQHCITLGIENSIAIKIQKLEVKRTQKSRVSMLNEILPNLNFSGTQSYNFGSTIDPRTNARVSSNIQFDNFFLNAQMNLINFNAIANSKKAKIGVELAKAEQEIIENEYKLQILESFYLAIYTQELVKIQNQQLVNTQNNLTRVSKEIEIGSKPKSDLYDLQFALSQEEKRLLETQQQYLLQKTQLLQLLNAETYRVENITLISHVLNIDTASNGITNPKIKVAKLAFENSKQEWNVQRARNLPVLTTFYQVSSFYFKPLNQPQTNVDTFRNQLDNNKNQSVGLQLSIPIFNGFKNNKAIISAKIETEKTKLKINQETLRITQQIEIENKNKQNYNAIQQKLDQVLQFAQASFTTTQAKFTSGKVDAFAFIIAKNNLLLSEYDLLKNKLQNQYIIYKINLIQNNQL